MKLHWTADGAEQSRTLAGDEVRIGRGSNNEIVLRDFSVSRSHATIRLNADGTWTIEDLGSTNGTFVNDRAVTEAPLRLDARLRIGDTVFRYEE